MFSWSSDIAILPADKVFGPASITEEVYEEGVKNVALSALMGINGTVLGFILQIFVYLYHCVLLTFLYMFILLQQLFLLMDKLAVERHIQ